MKVHPKFPNCEPGVDSYATELWRERRHHLETLESELQLIGMTPSDYQNCRPSQVQAIEELGRLLRIGN